MKIKTNWDELYKIRIADSRPEFQKHEVVKIILVMKILDRYKILRNKIRIYTEFLIDKGLKPDIYFENLKDKSVICYEIQKGLTDRYVKEKTERYNNLEIPFFNSVDFIIIPLKKFSNNINEISEKLEDYIV